MDWKRVFARGRGVRTSGAVVVAVIAFGLTACGSSSSDSSSSSSAPAAAGVAAGGAGASPTAASGPGTAGSDWFVTGTRKGQSLQGPVTVYRVTCGAITVGGSQGVQVIWSGTVKNNASGTSESIS